MDVEPQYPVDAATQDAMQDGAGGGGAPDATNATNLDDSKIHEGQCDHDNFEIIGQDAEEWDDNVI